MRPKNLPKGLDKHSDLWDQILQRIHGRNNYAIEIFKVKAVKAHQNWRPIENPKQQWIGCANECVDIAVKAHVKTKYASQLAISTQILQERKANFEALHDFHMYIAESANRVFQKRSESWKQGICGKVHGVSTEDFYDELVKEPLISFCVQMQPEILDACPCTSVFAEKLITWFNKLKWPDVQKTNHDTRRCSLLELYADFVLSANTLAPAQLIPKWQNKLGTLIWLHALLVNPYLHNHVFGPVHLGGSWKTVRQEISYN